MKIKVKVKTKTPAFTHVGRIHLTTASPVKVQLLNCLREKAQYWVDRKGVQYRKRDGHAHRGQGRLDLKSVSPIQILDDAPAALKAYYAN